MRYRLHSSHQKYHGHRRHQECLSHFIATFVKAGKEHQIKDAIENQPKSVPGQSGINSDRVIGYPQHPPKKHKRHRKQKLEQLQGCHQEAFSPNAFSLGNRQCSCIKEIVGFPCIDEGDIRGKAAKHKNNTVRIGRYHHQTPQKCKHRRAGVQSQAKFLSQQFHPNPLFLSEA